VDLLYHKDRKEFVRLLRTEEEPGIDQSVSFYTLHHTLQEDQTMPETISDVQKYAKLALLFIGFLKDLESALDPTEKTLIDDTVLEFLEKIAQKLAD
jgi:hypothetical protein